MLAVVVEFYLSVHIDEAEMVALDALLYLTLRIKI
jgi:hypothetical protein